MIYRSSYDSEKLRGIDDPLTPRPWDITNILTDFDTEDKKLLDLGAGTGFKVLPLQSKYKEIVCLEISKSMVEAARKILPFNNVKVIQGDNYKLPFENHSFDVVVSFLSFWDIKEIHRVLNPGGFILLELIGCEDKKDFKLFFGNDEKGIRGQNLQYDAKTYQENLYKEFRAYFNHVSIQNGYWDTFYSPAGILKLLANTPTIRGYNYLKDKNAIKRACQSLTMSNGIKIKQNRVLLYAKNPK